MTTINSVDVPLSGNTGTGNFVGSTSPTLITPNIGVATATSVAFSDTTKGLIGTTSGTNASTSYVGYVTSSVVADPGNSYSPSGAEVGLCTLTLGAGNYKIWGNLLFNPAATTVITSAQAYMKINSVIAEVSEAYKVAQTQFYVGAYLGLVIPSRFANYNSTITVSLFGVCSYSVSTVQFCGGIYARRIR